MSSQGTSAGNVFKTQLTPGLVMLRETETKDCVICNETIVKSMIKAIDDMSYAAIRQCKQWFEDGYEVSLQVDGQGDKSANVRGLADAMSKAVLNQKSTVACSCTKASKQTQGMSLVFVSAWCKAHQKQTDPIVVRMVNKAEFKKAQIKPVDEHEHFSHAVQMLPPCEVDRIIDEIKKAHPQVDMKKISRTKIAEQLVTDRWQAARCMACEAGRAAKRCGKCRLVYFCNFECLNKVAKKHQEWCCNPKAMCQDNFPHKIHLSWIVQEEKKDGKRDHA